MLPRKGSPCCACGEGQRKGGTSSMTTSQQAQDDWATRTPFLQDTWSGSLQMARRKAPDETGSKSAGLARYIVLARGGTHSVLARVESSTGQ